MIDPNEINEEKQPEPIPTDNGAAWLLGEEEARRKIIEAKFKEAAENNSAALEEMVIDPDPTIREIEKSEEVE